MAIGVPAWLDAEVTVGEVDESAAVANLDRLSRQILGISGEEFQRRRGDGTADELRRRRGFTRVLAAAKLLD